jgi:hypothetical protein
MVKETMRLMEEIYEVIEEHGGWPIEWREEIRVNSEEACSGLRRAASDDPEERNDDHFAA